jgi:hypothetical protein
LSTTYNFSYLDLDIERFPSKDESGFYNFELSKSCESLSNPLLFRCSNQLFAQDCFNLFLRNNNFHLKQIDEMKILFGNMFWFENYKPENQGITFFFNYWELKWEPGLDFFSIHYRDVLRLLEIWKSIDINDYFSAINHIIPIDFATAENHRLTIEAWIEMFNEAVIKKKGIVFDVG